MHTRDKNQCNSTKVETTLTSEGPSAAKPAGEQPVCVIHSNHPLAFRTIEHAITRSLDLQNSVRRYSPTSAAPKAPRSEILVLDSCSVEQWQQALAKWQSEGGRVIVLKSPEGGGESEELEMLYLGAVGIVTFADDHIQKLPDAIHAVFHGKLWVSREVLNEYVKRTNLFLRRVSSPDRLFTSREQQIIDFLRQGLSNRQIANFLGISERTAKFHVSNVLRKCKIDSRRELVGTQSQALSSAALSVMGQRSLADSNPSGALLAKRAISA